MPQSSCICGKNQIEFDAKPILKFMCHCTDERKLTGAAFALNILYPTDTLKVISGKLQTFTKVADSGNEITNHSCNSCGGLLYRTSTGYPGTMVIKAGLVDGSDESEAFKPDVELFTNSRLTWLRPVEGAKQEPGDFRSSER